MARNEAARAAEAKKAAEKIIHTRPLGGDQYRDLEVYYAKASTNYWNSSKKPTGIYLASTGYRLTKTSYGSMRNWMTCQKGNGYLLITPLERYSAKTLRLVRERTRENADLIHDIIEGKRGSIHDLKALLEGTLPASAIAPATDAPAPVVSPTAEEAA